MLACCRPAKTAYMLLGVRRAVARVVSAVCERVRVCVLGWWLVEVGGWIATRGDTDRDAVAWRLFSHPPSHT